MHKSLPVTVLILLSFLKLRAISDEALNELVFQSDYIALVQLPNKPVDSLASMIHDLGTTYYESAFIPLRIFKENAIPASNQYMFIHHGFDKPGKDLYAPGERCYLFLSNGLPKVMHGRVSLLSQDAYPGAFTLINGGLQPEAEIRQHQLAELTRQSEFARHAREGNIKALERYVNEFISDHNTKNLLDKTYQPNLTNWLLSFPGIDGVMSDSCAIHISIWPGWTDTFFWVNTPEGKTEYAVTIQHGRTSRFPIPKQVRNDWVLRSLIRADGACDLVLQRCEEFRKNEKIDAYNNLIQLRIKEENLNWSVYDAPLHNECVDDMIRVELSLINTGDSAMFIRWPGKQNTGESLFSFYLINPETRQEYPVYSNETLYNQHEALPPQNTLLAAGERLSATFSINDPLGAYSSYYSNFRYSVPFGQAFLKAVYKPYPEAESDSVCWFPSFDSLTAYSAYKYKTAPAVYDSIQVKGKLIGTYYSYMNEYGQTGNCQGIMEVSQDYEKLQLSKGDTIAWKIPLSPEELAGNEFRPPFTFEIMKTGDEIEVWLLNSAKGGKIIFEDHQIRLLPTCSRLDVVQILEKPKN